MKTSFQELRNAEQSLNRILDKPIPSRLSYRMYKQAEKIKASFKAIEKGRVGLIEKHGEKKGQGTSVPVSKMKIFEEEFNAFLEKEFDLDIQLIPWDCIEKGNIDISASDLAVLQNFIEIPTKLNT